MSVNQDIPPDAHKIAPGDQVQIKGAVGPKMTVVGDDPDRSTHVECVYWDTSRAECDRFESIYVHRDSLAYFGDPVPTPPGAKRECVAYSRNEIARQVNNAAVILQRGAGSPDVDAVGNCIRILQDELAQHVDIPRLVF